MSGVGFLAAVKILGPGSRRRRRCEKQQRRLELPGYGHNGMQPDVVPIWDAAPPITPPAAFLPPGYKKGFPGEILCTDRAPRFFAYICIESHVTMYVLHRSFSSFASHAFYTSSIEHFLHAAEYAVW